MKLMDVTYYIQYNSISVLLTWLCVQGLFRIAASGAKVKKMKAAFDAGLVSMDDYRHDVHCIAGTMSC